MTVGLTFSQYNDRIGALLTEKVQIRNNFDNITCLRSCCGTANMHKADQPSNTNCTGVPHPTLAANYRACVNGCNNQNAAENQRVNDEKSRIDAEINRLNKAQQQSQIKQFTEALNIALTNEAQTAQQSTTPNPVINSQVNTMTAEKNNLTIPLLALAGLFVLV
jgi:thioester reductase-like protein